MKQKIIEILEKYLLDGFIRYNWQPLNGAREIEEMADEIAELFKNQK